MRVSVGVNSVAVREEVVVKEDVSEGVGVLERVRVFVEEGVRVGVPGEIEPVTVKVDVDVNVLVNVTEGVRVAVPVRVDEEAGVKV